MSKEKASKIIVHRIEFQQKERELLQTVASAYTANRILTPTVALMSDVSGMITLAAMLATVGIIIDLSGLNGESSVAELMERFQTATINEQATFFGIPNLFSIFQEKLNQLDGMV